MKKINHRFLERNHHWKELEMFSDILYGKDIHGTFDNEIMSSEDTEDDRKDNKRGWDSGDDKSEKAIDHAFQSLAQAVEKMRETVKEFEPAPHALGAGAGAGAGVAVWARGPGGVQFPVSPSDPALSAVLAAHRRRMGKKLLAAAQDGRVEHVRQLLDAGAHPDFAHGLTGTALHRAAKEGHVDVIDLLVERGATVNAQNYYGHTPLHVASYNDRSGICTAALLAAHADIEVRNRSGATALHYAVEAGNVAAVRALVAAGANTAAKNYLGECPADLAPYDCIRGLVVPGAGCDGTKGCAKGCADAGCFGGDWGAAKTQARPCDPGACDRDCVKEVCNKGQCVDIYHGKRPCRKSCDKERIVKQHDSDSQGSSKTEIQHKRGGHEACERKANKKDAAKKRRSKKEENSLKIDEGKREPQGDEEEEEEEEEETDDSDSSDSQSEIFEQRKVNNRKTKVTECNRSRNINGGSEKEMMPRRKNKKKEQDQRKKGKVKKVKSEGKSKKAGAAKEGGGKGKRKRRG